MSDTPVAPNETRRGVLDVSVIIPTRNRAESLRDTLESLKAQGAHGRFTHEVVVVDNGSVDQTRQVVDALGRSFPVPLRYVLELNVGRPYALNTGMRQAAGELFVITDDDVLLHPDWLFALWSSITEERAEAAAGRIVPRWLSAPPAWLTDDVRRDLNRTGLGCLDHGPRRLRTWAGDDCRWVGGNMAIRREAMARVGGFDERMIRGQDSEYYERCLAAGLRIVYEPAAVVAHLIGPDRLTLQYLRQWRHRQGVFEARRIPWKPLHLITVMPLWRWAVSLRIIGRWVAATLLGRSWWQRFYCELKVREEAGVWGERLRQWPRAWWVVRCGQNRSA